jgi:hypothetical protein
MLLKVTCPSCGQSKDAPEHILGKELRCACGTRIRVVGQSWSDFQPSEPANGPPRSVISALRLSEHRRGVASTEQCELAARDGTIRQSTVRHREWPPWAYASIGVPIRVNDGPSALPLTTAQIVARCKASVALYLGRTYCCHIVGPS